jgi:hypothetical protein
MYADATVAARRGAVVIARSTFIGSSAGRVVDRSAAARETVIAASAATVALPDCGVRPVSRQG